MEAENRIPFAEAFTKAFREVVSRLSDQDAYAVSQWLGTPLTVYREALQRDLIGSEPRTASVNQKRWN